MLHVAEVLLKARRVQRRVRVLDPNGKTRIEL
jgi:hypothetical protein